MDRFELTEELQEVLITISSDLGEGDQFMAPIEFDECHQIVGWLIGANNTSTMFSFVVNHPDGLKYVNKWAWVSEGLAANTCNYKLITASNYTICDMIAHFDRVKGF